MTERTTLAGLVNRGVLYVNDGYRTKTAELGNEGIPVLRVSEVRDGVILPAFKDHVRHEFRPKMGGKTSRPNDVLITTKGTVGRSAIIPVTFPEFVYSPQLCVLRVLDDQVVDPRWLYAWVRSPQFQAQASGVSGQTDMAPYINLVDLRNMTVELPPPATQRSIAEVLGALDDKIDANFRLASLCESLAVAHVEAVRNVRVLSDFVLLCREQVNPETFAVQPVDHFSLPAFDSRRLPDRCPGDTVKSTKFRLRRPVVLVSKLNPHIPRVWFAVPSTECPAVASTEFVVLEPQDGWAPELIYAACARPSFNAGLAEQVTGTTGSHQRVRPQDVVSAPVADLASVPEAVRDAVVGLVRRALSARREGACLAALRDILLPPLVSGEIRLRDAAAAVAEVRGW